MSVKIKESIFDESRANNKTFMAPRKSNFLSSPERKPKTKVTSPNSPAKSPFSSAISPANTVFGNMSLLQTTVQDSKTNFISDSHAETGSQI